MPTHHHSPIQISDVLEMLRSCAKTSNRFVFRIIQENPTHCEASWTPVTYDSSIFSAKARLNENKQAEVDLVIEASDPAKSAKASFVITKRNEAEPMLSWLQPRLQAL